MAGKNPLPNPLQNPRPDLAIRPCQKVKDLRRKIRANRSSFVQPTLLARASSGPERLKAQVIIDDSLKSSRSYGRNVEIRRRFPRPVICQQLQQAAYQVAVDNDTDAHPVGKPPCHPQERSTTMFHRRSNSSILRTAYSDLKQSNHTPSSFRVVYLLAAAIVRELQW